MFSAEFAVRGVQWNAQAYLPLKEHESVARQVYMKDIDYLFDTYRNSRSSTEGIFKISWHLVLCANEFCMERLEQKVIAL